MKQPRSAPRILYFLLLSGLLLIPSWTQAAVPEDSEAESETSSETVSVTDEEYLPLIEGAGLTYTARAEAEHSVVITREEISASRAPDLLTLLRDSAALSVINYGGYGAVGNGAGGSVSVRGFTGDRLIVEVDGVRMNSPQSGEFNFNGIDPESIEKIEIVYTGAPGAVLKITTITKKDAGFSFGAAIANTAFLPPADAQTLIDSQRLTLTLGYGGRKFSGVLEGFLTSAGNRFIYEDTNGEQRLRGGNAVRDGGATARVCVELPAWSRLTLTAGGYLAEKETAGPVNSLASGEQRELSVRETLSLDIGRLGTDNLGTALTASHSYNEMEWSDSAGKAEHRVTVLDLANNWMYTVTERLSLEAGAAWRFTILDSSNIGTLTHQAGTVTLSARVKADRGILIEPKLEVKIDAEAAALVPVPIMHIGKSFGSGRELQFSAARLWKEPDLNDLYWTADAFARGNPDLSDEQGWTANLTFRHGRENKYNAEHSLYGTWYSNAILWQVDNSVWQPDNAGEAVYLGMDNRLTFKNTDGPELTVSHALLLTRLLSGELTFADGKQMPYQPTHTLSLSLSDTVSILNWNLKTRYESRRYISTANVTALPPVFLLDAGLSVKISNTLEWYLDGRNLFGESYQLMDGYPMPGLSLTAGIKLRL